MHLSFKTEVMITTIVALLLAGTFIIDGSGRLGVESIRVVTGVLLLLFLPGWWISKVLFHRNEIDLLERIALSFAFSICVIPLVVFYLNLAGLPINAWLVWGVAVGSMVVCGGYHLRKQHHHTVNEPTFTLPIDDETDHSNSL